MVKSNKQISLLRQYNPPLVTPAETVQKWVSAFNAHDANLLQTLYADNAVNHQMPNLPVTGKEAIGEMFRAEFLAAPAMFCIPVQIIEQGQWAVLEWKDPKGFCGCGFFHVVDGLIKTQRGYWDKLSVGQLYSTK